MRLRNALLTTSLIAISHAAVAQTSTDPSPAPASSRATQFDASYFAPFAPRTALDIARRVPGFTLDLGSAQGDLAADVRGFAGTAGNVVINGARPSSKAESLETVLARIPAQRVVRVEVGPGDRFGSDYAGKSQVLNVIMSAEAGIDANVTASAQPALHRLYQHRHLRLGADPPRRFDDQPVGRDRAQPPVRGRHRHGQRRRVRRASRVPAQVQQLSSTATPMSRAAGRSSGRRTMRCGSTPAGSRAASTSSSATGSSPAGGEPHDDSLFQRLPRPVIELGGDITRPLAGGALKLVGLATRRKREDFDAYIGRNGLLEDDPEVNGGFEQTLDAKRNETIGASELEPRRPRRLLGRSRRGRRATTRSTARCELVGIDEDGERFPIDLLIEDSLIKEKRGELFVSAGRNLSPALRIDGGVNFETSQLKVRGDAIADRSLRFFKPNLSLDWKAGDGWHSRLSVRRTVAQLDFYDFISFAELSTDRVSAGNENLQPQRTWEFRLMAERPMLGDGLVKLDLGHDLVSMLQDRILIFDEDGEGFDAPGNLGTGKRYFATLTARRAAVPTVEGTARQVRRRRVQRTRVEDPI